MASSPKKVTPSHRLQQSKTKKSYSSFMEMEMTSSNRILSSKKVNNLSNNSKKTNKWWDSLDLSWSLKQSWTSIRPSFLQSTHVLSSMAGPQLSTSRRSFQTRRQHRQRETLKSSHKQGKASLKWAQQGPKQIWETIWAKMPWSTVSPWWKACLQTRHIHLSWQVAPMCFSLTIMPPGMEPWMGLKRCQVRTIDQR